MKTLKLTLNKAAFEVMVTGEKKNEYRKKNNWIMSRLWKKTGEISGIPVFSLVDYDYVEFTNGYGKNKPRFLVEFIDLLENIEPFNETYSNGLKVQVNRTDQIIRLGKIIKIENYKIAS